MPLVHHIRYAEVRKRFFCTPFSLITYVLFLVLICMITMVCNGQDFVIPALRGTGSQADFAYWDLFGPGASNNSNYLFANRPALLDGMGRDAALNPTTVLMPSPTPPRATLVQNLTSTCFVTSSSALYSFAAATGFEVSYSPLSSTSGNVNNVIFQIQSGGSRPLASSVKLRYKVGTQTYEVSPIYKALDDLQTGAFGERVIFGYQWNLTGFNLRDVKVVFRSSSSSMALWQAQLDATVGLPFQQSLGYLLNSSSLPLTRFGKPGSVSAIYGPGVDGRFYLAGQQITVEGQGITDWEPVGFVVAGNVINQFNYTFNFPAADETVTGLFSPLTYEAWRTAVFYHANSIIGTANDYTNNAISAPAVDHDKDGLSNLAEYAFGCDPYTPDLPRSQTTYHTVTVSGVTYPALTYRSNGAPESYADLLYEVEHSTDLATWTGGNTILYESLRQPDGTLLITVRTTTPVSNLQRCFMRVNVQQL